MISANSPALCILWAFYLTHSHIHTCLTMTKVLPDQTEAAAEMSVLPVSVIQLLEMPASSGRLFHHLNTRRVSGAVEPGHWRHGSLPLEKWLAGQNWQVPSADSCMPGLQGGQSSLGPSSGSITAPGTSLRHNCGSIHRYVLYVCSHKHSLITTHD